MMLAKNSISIILSVLGILCLANAEAPPKFRPTLYRFHFIPDFISDTVTALIDIYVVNHEQTINKVQLNADFNGQFKVVSVDALVNEDGKYDYHSQVNFRDLVVTSRIQQDNLLRVYTKEDLQKGVTYRMRFKLDNIHPQYTDGLYIKRFNRSNINGNSYDQGKLQYHTPTMLLIDMTQIDPSRPWFPCFIDPEYKAPIEVMINLPKDFDVAFPTHATIASVHESKAIYYKATPPISLKSVAFIAYTFENTSLISPEYTNNVESFAKLPKENITLEMNSDLIAYAIETLESITNTKIPNLAPSQLPSPGHSVFIFPDELRHKKPIHAFGLLAMDESFFESKNPTKMWRTVVRSVVQQWFTHTVIPSDRNTVISGLEEYLTEKTLTKMIRHSEHSEYLKYYDFVQSAYRLVSTTPLEKSTMRSNKKFIAQKYLLLFNWLNTYVGDKTFTKILEIFFKKFNPELSKSGITFTDEEFWSIWELVKEDEIKKKKRLSSKIIHIESFKEIADSWLASPTISLLSSFRDTKTNTMYFSQMPFAFGIRKYDVKNDEKQLQRLNHSLWLPISLVSQNNISTKTGIYKASNSQWFNITTDHNITEDVLRDYARNSQMSPLPQIMNISLGNQNTLLDDYIIFSPSVYGPVVHNYDEENWERIIKQFPTLLPRMKSKIIHDAILLAHTGKLPFGTMLRVTSCLKPKKEDLMAWMAYISLMKHNVNRIDGFVLEKYKEYLAQRLSDLFDVTLEIPTDDVDDIEPFWMIEMQKEITNAMCSYTTAQCDEESRISELLLATKNMTDLDFGKFCGVMRQISPLQWNAIYTAFNKEYSQYSDREKKYANRILSCAIEKYSLIDYLNHLFLESSNSSFIVTDSMSDEELEERVFVPLSSDVHGCLALLSFIEDHFKVLYQRYGNSTRWNMMLKHATKNLHTDSDLRILLRFYQHTFKRIVNKNAIGKEIIEAGIERVREELPLNVEINKAVTKWFDAIINEPKVIGGKEEEEEEEEEDYVKN